ncbi:MAG TPA: DMT family transporter [Trebonia sp.]|jgi:drug/metabolite transporter (DMT)-like permease|nr:DMT family transporter [Trebonia sp.]
MNNMRMRAVTALIASGVAWGTSVPLSKVALGWLGPGWLTVARFGLAAVVLLAIASRTGRLHAAMTLPVLAAGAAGYGLSVVVQNAGVERTSVTHASLIIGGTPVLVAIIAACWQHAVARPVAWAGFALSLAGVAFIAGGHGPGAAPSGDALVLVAVALSAAVTVAQGRLLQGRDPIAVTAVLFLGATLAALPFAASEGLPAAPASAAVILTTVALAIGGTLIPFSLFAFGQKRVSAEVAGAFLNLEPLVGAAVGIIAFGDPAGARQFGGGLAIMAGIALSCLPLLSVSARAATPSGDPASPAAVPAPAPALALVPEPAGSLAAGSRAAMPVAAMPVAAMPVAVALASRARVPERLPARSAPPSGPLPWAA